MRNSRLILIGAGMAVLAALLTTGLQSMLGGGGPRRVPQSVVATRDLAAGHTIAPEDVQALPAKAATQGALASVAAATGRTVVVPLAKGQALQETDLVARGSGAAIASQLKPGFRAMTVTLRDSGPGVALYPGASVDVLATFDRTSRVSGQRETVTRTVIERARVLAVNDEAVGVRTTDSADRRANQRKMTVTLAVTPEQAAQVELASARGTVGITLRSDADASSSASAMATTQSLLDEDLTTAAPQTMSPPAAATSASASPAPTAPAPSSASRGARTWEVIVIRGDDRSRHEFPAQPSGSAPSAP